MPITRDCTICGIRIRVESLKHDVCGDACAALKHRRAKYADVKPGHPEYIATNDTQRGLHRTASRKRNRSHAR